jgi:hypothetical protein
MFLRKSTASQSRMVGPFVDDTDFKTLKTALTIANTDVKISKNGAAGVNKNSGGGTHRNNGMYSLTFDATDSDTVGEFEVSILITAALVVVAKFFVLPGIIYDALFGATATLWAGFDAQFRGAVTGATTTTTLIDSSLVQAANDHWKGRILIFTSGSLQYQATDITAFDASLDKLTFTALTGAPSNGDTYIII